MLLCETKSVEYAKSNIVSVMRKERKMIQRNEIIKRVGMITELLQHKGSLIRKGETFFFSMSITKL